jgi:AraC-like DNA-binding protein
MAIRIQANQLAFINPGEVHTGSSVADTALHYFSFYPDTKTLQEVAAAIDMTLPPGFNFHQAVLDQCSLTQKFRLLADSFLSGSEPLQQQEVFFDCMHGLFKQPGQEYTIAADIKKDNRVELLIDFIRVHFKEDITLQQMGELVRLNPFHLVRLFKKITGLSPYEYLLVLRMEYARQLLRKGYKVQDAALEAGFYDASHFNRMFCRVAGASPKSFRSSKRQYRTILSRR